MTPLDFPDISAGHAVPNLAGQSLIGFRACLGASFVDADFAAQLAEAKKASPGIVTLDYCFLAGPKRGQMVAQQMAFYAKAHKAELSCLDWEGDSYTQNGVVVDNGIQPFSQVLAAIAAARKLGLNPGVYGSAYLFTPEVIKALIAAKVPFIWVADYPGPLPAYILNCGIPVAHQYQGVGLDRSRFFITLDALHKLAGRAVVTTPKLRWTVAPVGNAVTVAPGAAFYAISAPVPTVVYSHNGAKPTTFPAPLTAPGWTCVLDGGTPCAVRNADLTKGS